MLRARPMPIIAERQIESDTLACTIQDPTAITKKFNIPERKRKDLEKIIQRKIDI
jgi:hypothetical protein